MSFFNKTKGAVSLFLAIIMLPTFAFAGVFVDISRVKIAEEVVLSSADLALNTVLSSYDSDLKDYFGLFASSQDTSDVVAAAKEYFKSCMVSVGVSTTEAGEYADNIADAFMGDDDIRDMLQLSVEGDINITKAKNGAMDNPAMVKKGIVEFMKYRAPVNGVADLFSKIKDEGIEEKMEDLSKETTMTEKKREFYKAEEALLNQAEVAYKAIKKYRDYKTTSTGKKIGDEEFLNSFSRYLAKPYGDKDFETVYREAHQKLVKNLVNTHDSNWNRISFIEPKSFEYYNVTTYSDSNKATLDDVTEVIETSCSSINNYVNKRSNLQTSWANIGGRQSADYPLQYWVQLTNKCKSNYDSYISAANTLKKSFTSLENAITYAEDGVLDSLVKGSDFDNSNITFETDTDGMISIENIYKTIKNNTYKLEVYSSGFSAYKNINSQLYNLPRSDLLGLTDWENVSYIYNIHNKLNKYLTDFDKAAKLAKKAKEETNKLKNYIEAYHDAFVEWKEIANDPELDSSDLAEDDRKAIAELEESGIDYFSEASVDELVTKLGNIQTVCETFAKDVRAIKYNNTSVTSISGYKKFVPASKAEKSKIVKNKTSLDNYVSSIFSFTIGEQIQRIEIHDKRSLTFDGGDAYVISEMYHLDITVPKLELYTWMEKELKERKSQQMLNKSQHGFDVSDESSADSADKSIDKKADEATVDTSPNLTGKNFSEWEGAALPSNGAYEDLGDTSVSSKLSEVADFTSEIFSNFGETIGAAVVNVRDDLFMVDYVMSMFTYDTFKTETCYAMLEAQNQSDGLTPTLAQNKYPGLEWEKSEDNKTLTLTPRSDKYNWAYGSEVEYILYGSSSNTANKAKAYGNIFLIRYALNIAPVYDRYYENDPIIDMVALALEVFAHIPQALTKNVICLAITAAEAAIDINYLKWGIPVALIKNEDELVVSYQSLFAGKSENTPTNKSDLTLQYTDYIKIFLFIKLIGEAENKIYLRTADVIQANMSLSTNNFKFSLAKSVVYYNFNATVVAKPMWSKLLAVDNFGDISSATGWRTININITRGY